MTTKFKVVCRSCNSGWMSRAEEAVRPFLAPMINGEDVDLSLDAQRRLAEWIVLKTMVADCEVPLDSVFTAGDRAAFFESRTLPETEIWLFICGAGRWNSCFRRQSATMSFRPITPSITRHPNVQGTTFGLGAALIYCTTSRSDELSVKSNFGDEIAVRLFPFLGSPVQWPPLKGLTEEGAEDLSETMRRIRESVAGRWHVS